MNVMAERLKSYDLEMEDVNEVARSLFEPYPQLQRHDAKPKSDRGAEETCI